MRRQPAVLPQHQPGQARREHRLAQRGADDGVEQLLARRRLHQVAGRAGLHRLEHVGLLPAGRQHQHAHRRVGGHQRPGHLDTGQHRQLQVEDDDLRPGGGRPAYGLTAVTCGRHHVVAGLRQVARDRLAPHRVVVDHHHPRHVVSPPARRSSISVPAPGADCIVSVAAQVAHPPVDRLTPRRSAPRPGRRRAGPAAMPLPSSRTLTTISSAVVLQQHPGPRVGTGVRGDVGEGGTDRCRHLAGARRRDDDRGRRGRHRHHRRGVRRQQRAQVDLAADLLPGGAPPARAAPAPARRPAGRSRLPRRRPPGRGGRPAPAPAARRRGCRGTAAPAPRSRPRPPAPAPGPTRRAGPGRRCSR